MDVHGHLFVVSTLQDHTSTRQTLLQDEILLKSNFTQMTILGARKAKHLSRQNLLIKLGVLNFYNPAQGKLKI